VTAKLPERIKRALDAYNDVVIAWHLNVSVDEVDNRYEQLVAAIAEHVAPVDAPTEAEIEAWRSKMERGFFRYGLTIQNYTAEAVALMRRAAAATPTPSALERLRERVDRAAAVENIELGEWRAFDRVLDWIDEEREAKR
jgi:hypothetical protein